MLESINCLTCKKEFIPRKKITKFCSLSCNGKVRRSKHPHFKITCGYCGKVYEVAYWKKDISHYCSNKCRAIHTGKLRTKDIRERFLSYVSEPNENGCKEWLGCKDRGYGVFFYTKTPIKKQKYASRAAYELFIGEIPEGYEVCHRCDNRLCVSTEHLWLGTHRENMLDMIAKGRHNPRGKKGKLIINKDD